MLYISPLPPPPPLFWLYISAIVTDDWPVGNTADTSHNLNEGCSGLIPHSHDHRSSDRWKEKKPWFLKYVREMPIKRSDWTATIVVAEQVMMLTSPDHSRMITAGSKDQAISDYIEQASGQTI